MRVDLAVGRPILPKEHGGWAMLLTPPVVALGAAGANLWGLLAALGWVVAYCMRGPVETLLGTAPTGKAGLQHAAPAVARFWLLLFGGAALLLLTPVLISRPTVAIWLAGALAVLGILMLFVRAGQTRSIAAGVIASAGLMAGGPLYYEASYGTAGREGWTLALACLAFFAGSVFRVKTLARERRSASFRWVSVGLHLLATVAAALAAAAGMASWLVVLALALPLGWALYGAVRAGAAVSLAVIGKGEQWLTIAFGLLLIVALRSPSLT
ncbi:MAG TPA: YwiC-like family protein [Symbiobacteriaceae bacterium]|jgi:hypothetical protein|nr:YwiC-like family protein [Symbiobacteriaceae bacterium]